MALSLVPPILVIPQLHQNIFTQVYSIIVCHRKSDVDTFFTHGMRALYAKFLDLRLFTLVQPGFMFYDFPVSLQYSYGTS